MTVWAISVAGIILLTVLCDAIIPEGKTSKYIKTVTTLIAILVMLSPLPIFFNGDFALDEFVERETTGFELQQSYLNYTYSVQIEALEQNCEKTLNAKGFEDVSVNVAVSVQNNEMSVKNVLVRIKNLVINNSVGNISIVEEVKTAVSELLSIDKSQVAVYGKD